jgi:hypothetical protein
MFNKNHKDPLVDAVQAAMQKGAQDRAAIAKVNEAFGIQSKRQLPHERYAEYDKAIATALNGGGAVALVEETVEEATDVNGRNAASKKRMADYNKNNVKTNKMVKSVFKKAFKGTKKSEVWEEEVEQLDELSKDTLKSYVGKAAKSKEKSAAKAKEHAWRANDAGTFKTLDKHITKRNQEEKKVANRTKGIETASKKLSEEEQIDEKRVDSMGSDAMETMSRRDREAANDQAKLKKTLAAKDKAKRVQSILKRRLGKGDGTESVSQSRREDK